MLGRAVPAYAPGHAPGQAVQLRDLARAALRHVARGPRESELRPLLGPVCEAARAGGLRVEQLLVVLKEEWRHLPAPCDTVRHEADSALARAIGVCIQEYYRVDRAG